MSESRVGKDPGKMAEAACFREFAAGVNDGRIVFPVNEPSQLSWLLDQFNLKSTFGRAEDGTIKLVLAEADLAGSGLDCLTLAYHLAGPTPAEEDREAMITHCRRVDAYLRAVNPLLKKHFGYTYRRVGRQLRIAESKATYLEEPQFDYLNNI